MKTPADLDLFGDPVIGPVPTVVNEGRKPTVKRGYAAPPGTGPAGETCRGCRHYARIEHAKVYLKCELMRRFWTGGPGTDIKAASPACKHWEKY